MKVQSSVLNSEFQLTHATRVFVLELYPILRALKLINIFNFDNKNHHYEMNVINLNFTYLKK